MSDVMTNAEHKIRAGQTIRVILGLAVVAAVVIFGVANRDKVNVDWVFNNATAPLWAVIGISAAAGAIIGYLAHPRRG